MKHLGTQRHSTNEVSPYQRRRPRVLFGARPGTSRWGSRDAELSISPRF